MPEVAPTVDTTASTPKGKYAIIGEERRREKRRDGGRDPITTITNKVISILFLTFQVCPGSFPGWSHDALLI